MRQYELIYIVQPDLDEETTQGIVERVTPSSQTMAARSSRLIFGAPSPLLMKSRTSGMDTMSTWKLRWNRITAPN